MLWSHSITDLDEKLKENILSLCEITNSIKTFKSTKCDEMMILIWYFCREKITLKIKSADNVMSFRFHVALFYLYCVHCHWHVLCKLICFFVSLLHLQDSLERSRCPTPSVFPYTHSSSPPTPTSSFPEELVWSPHGPEVLSQSGGASVRPRASIRAEEQFGKSNRITLELPYPYVNLLRDFYWTLKDQWHQVMLVIHHPQERKFNVADIYFPIDRH